MARDYNVNRKTVDSDQYVYREERDLSKTRVDWGEISKDLTKTITDIRDDRQSRKDELDKAQTESMNKLGEFDQYNSKSLNESVLEGSEWSKNALAEQYDLMRRGLISPSEYKRYEQRTKDSFSALKGNLDNFAKHYNEAELRVQNGESNIGEMAINGSLSGLANLGQYELSGNPATGELCYIKTGNDPATDEPYDVNDPANQISLGVINARINQKMDYTVLAESAAAQVEKFGEVITAEEMARQGVSSYEDWRQLDVDGDGVPDTDQMIQDMVGVIAGSPAQKLSILQDAGYSKADFTQDPEVAAADPSKILMTPDPNMSGSFIFEFNDEQTKIIEERAERALQVQISQKAEFTKGHQVVFAPQDTPTTIGLKDRTLKASSMYEEVVNLVTGDAASAESAATALASLVNDSLKEGGSPIAEDGIKRADDSNSWTITLEDGSTFTVDALAGDNTPKSMPEIVKEIFQEVNPYDDINVVMAAQAFTGEVPDVVGEGGATGNVKVKPIQPFDYQQSVTIDGNKIGPEAYLESQLDESFDDGDNATGPEIEAAFDTVIRELIIGNPALENSGWSIEATDADDTTGEIVFNFPGLDGPRKITDTNHMTVATAYSQMQKFLDEWREVVNADGVPEVAPGDVLLEDVIEDMTNSLLGGGSGTDAATSNPVIPMAGPK